MRVEVRTAETDADLEGWIRVKRAVFPNESAWTCRSSVSVASRTSLVLVAELDGEIVGAGLAGPSTCRVEASSRRGSIPDARRRGVGRRMLHAADRPRRRPWNRQGLGVRRRRRRAGVRRAFRLRGGRPRGRAGDRAPRESCPRRCCRTASTSSRSPTAPSCFARRTRSRARATRTWRSTGRRGPARGLAA